MERPPSKPIPGGFVEICEAAGPPGICFLSSCANLKKSAEVVVRQNQWYHFGVGAPPILVYFSGDSDVHWGYGILTHGHLLNY